VPKEHKREFMERLHQRNIHPAALFPDIEGLCRYGGHVLDLYGWKMAQHLERISEQHRETARSLDGRD